MCTCAKAAEFNDLKIRTIVVVLQNAQVSFQIKKGLFHDLEGLEVTGDQLDSFS